MLQVMNLIGDVKGKVAVMVDDMIDTAGNLSLSCPNLLHVLLYEYMNFYIILSRLRKNTRG